MSLSLSTRAALRAAVCTALTNGVTAVAGRIHTGRAWPQMGPGQQLPATLPALLVEDGPRIISAVSAGFAQLRCQIRIRARVQGRDDAAREAALDALDTAIRAALFGNVALAALVLVVEEIASDREQEAGGQAVLAEDTHLVTFRLAGGVP